MHHAEAKSPILQPLSGFSVSRAFSLIELIVVMLVIGIMAVLVAEKAAELLSSTRARMAANDLGIHLNYIRNMAMDQERTMRVMFSANSYSVAFADTNAPDGFTAAKDPVTQAPWQVDVSVRFPGVSLANVNIDGMGGGTLYFNATNGIPMIDTHGAGLATNGIITFNSGVTVTIAPETGYINSE